MSVLRIEVFWVFCSEKSCKSINQDITWRNKIWILKSMVLRRFFKIIQSEKNSFQIPRSFQTKEWSKTGWIRKILHLRGWLMCHMRLDMCHLRMRQCCHCFKHHLHPVDTICARLWAKIAYSLFFKLDRCKNPSFLWLNPKQSFNINRDPCTHYFSFRKLTVQGKCQASELQGRISSSSCSL